MKFLNLFSFFGAIILGSPLWTTSPQMEGAGACVPNRALLTPIWNALVEMLLLHRRCFRHGLLPSNLACIGPLGEFKNSKEHVRMKSTTKDTQISRAPQEGTGEAIRLRLPAGDNISDETWSKPGATYFRRGFAAGVSTALPETYLHTRSRVPGALPTSRCQNGHRRRGGAAKSPAEETDL